jgi:guanyl-specific ribonuclease Sa
MDVPAATVVVQYPIGAKLDLKINGKAVDSALIGRTETDTQQNSIVQTWYGVSLGGSENILTAQTTTNGVVGQATSVKIKVRGAPTAIDVRTVESRVPADGRSLLSIEGTLIDENGNLSKQEGIVTLSASAGEFAGVDQDRDQTGFQVPVKDGKYSAKLRAGIEAQTIKIRATTLNLEAFTQAQFETSLRAGITTGVIDVRLGSRGTDYYRNFRDFLPADGNNSPNLSVTGQAFSTGKVGDWLFTGAYNSYRSLNRNCGNDNNLFRTITSSTCDELYPVTGDTSKVDVLTPSQDSVYAKFERSTGMPNSLPDMGMWGDYNTSEFATKSQQFSATNRQLHGAKANYNIGNLQASAFYGDNVQGFQRDTIAPDGTSGYFFLSRRLTIGGSEQIAIETEELNRPGTLSKSEPLARGTDYDIDYDRGTILLRRPLLRTSVDDRGTVMVNKIVATYQYYTPGANTNIFGGRLQYNLSRELNRESWLGTSLVKEQQGVRNFSLYGIDALVSLSPTSNISAEYAKSTNATNFDGRSVDGEAVRVEAQTKISDTIQGRAFYRNAGAGFSNNATSSFVPGQTRYGADVTAKVSANTNIRLQVDRENNNGIAPAVLFPNLADVLAARSGAVPGTQLDNNLTTLTAGVQQKFGTATVDLDYVSRNREDRLAANNTGNSSQLRSRVSVPVANNLTFNALNETAISSQQDTLYPNRTAFGLDWAAYPGINVKLNQNFITGGQLANSAFTSLDIDANRKVASNTTVTGRYSLNPYQSVGAIGLQQGIVLGPGLKMDLAYERLISGNTGGYTQTGAGQQFPQPYAPGQSGASVGVGSGNSYSVGLSYTDNPNYQANAKYEHRDGVNGSSSGINAGITGKITPELTALARYQQNSVANQVLSNSSGLGSTSDLKLGLAYRNPISDQVNALLSYQYRRNPSTIPNDIIPDAGSGSEDNTIAAEVIYAPNWQWELYGKYALRSGTTYLSTNANTNNSLSLGQIRATYRLGYSWDLVADGRIIRQPNLGYTETGLALELGYYLTPNLRLSGGYGFGRVDDPTISNGNRAASGPYLGFTVKINELFNGFGLQKPTPAQQQESAVKPLAPSTPGQPPAATIQPPPPPPQPKLSQPRDSISPSSAAP